MEAFPPTLCLLHHLGYPGFEIYKSSLLYPVPKVNHKKKSDHELLRPYKGLSLWCLWQQALFPSILRRLTFTSLSTSNNTKCGQDHSHYQKADASPQSILCILQSSLTKELTLTNPAQRGSLTAWSSYATRKRYYCQIHLPLLASGSTGRLSGKEMS